MATSGTAPLSAVVGPSSSRGYAPASPRTGRSRRVPAAERRNLPQAPPLVFCQGLPTVRRARSQTLNGGRVCTGEDSEALLACGDEVLRSFAGEEVVRSSRGPEEGGACGPWFPWALLDRPQEDGRRRVPFLCPRPRHSRGSGDGPRPLRARPLLGAEARAGIAGRACLCLRDDRRVRSLDGTSPRLGGCNGAGGRCAPRARRPPGLWPSVPLNAIVSLTPPARLPPGLARVLPRWRGSRSPAVPSTFRTGRRGVG